jgi:hypothetical protein
VWEGPGPDDGTFNPAVITAVIGRKSAAANFIQVPVLQRSEFREIIVANWLRYAKLRPFSKQRWLDLSGSAWQFKDRYARASAIVPYPMRQADPAFRPTFLGLPETVSPAGHR